MPPQRSPAAPPLAWIALRPVLVGLLAAAGLALAACTPAASQPANTPDPAVTILLVAQDAPAGVSEDLALAELRARLPPAVRLPTWAPEGFALQPGVGIAAGNDQLLLMWQHPDGSAVDLVVSPSAPALPAIPPRFVRQLQVNNHPALLVYRMPALAPNPSERPAHLMLIWEQDDLHYTLSATGRSASKQAIVDMAASLA
jgi:hypothetical protein